MALAQNGANTKRPYHYVDFICGWGAGCIETCIMFPANKIIFRQQLHGFSAQSAMKQIQSEGMSRLYRGLLPPLIMRTSSRALMFGLYDRFQERLSCPHSPPNTSLTLCHAQASFLAGLCEATLCPLERIQVLLQHSQYHDDYRNTGEAFKALRVHGLREYYRGLSVVMLRNSLSNILFFTLRDPFKQSVLKLDGPFPSPALHIIADFVSGGVLGASISTVFYPLNVVKNHMQSKIGTQFENPFRVFGEIWRDRNGSLKSLYLGVHLNFTRSLVAWGITNSIYELLRRTLISL